MADRTVSNENKELAKYISSIVASPDYGAANRKVHGYWDEKNENCLDIFSCDYPDEPNPDAQTSKLKTYCTIGLSDYENIVEMKDGKKNIPVEILMSGYREFDKIPNILSTCGFYLMKEKWNCQPGSVFMRMIDFYYEKEMRHIIFLPMFFWRELQPLELKTKTVNWLAGIPISDNELEYKEKNGYDAFRKLFFKENNVDYYDWDRKSVI